MSRNQPLRILIVEDHDNSRDALQRLLEAQGHVPLPARSVAEGMAVANASSIDLVIGDVGLPDGDGSELMRVLREAHGIPGIAVSGYADAEHEQQMVRSGVCVHLLKPIGFVQLVEAIEKCRPPVRRRAAADG